METPIRKTNKTKRCLFGKPNSAKLDRFLDDNLTKLQQQKQAEFKEQYNYDLENGVPLETKNSRYEWQRVTSAPAFYSRQPHRRNADSRKQQEPVFESNRKDKSKSKPTKLTLRPQNVVGSKRKHNQADSDEVCKTRSALNHHDLSLSPSKRAKITVSMMR